MNSPAKEAASRAADKLGKAVLPHLLGQLDGTTESFRALARKLSADSDATLSDSAALAHVEQAQGQAHRVGWFLGCLASASGTDLLIARREENGLRLFCGLVLDALANPAILSPAQSHLPRIATGIGRGWELSFIAGFLFYAALRGEFSKGQLRWSIEPRNDQSFLRVESGLQSGDGDLLEQLTGVLPGARAQVSAESAEIRFPSAWLV